MNNQITYPLNLPWLRAYASSDVGKKRSHNEDRFLLQAWEDQTAVLAVVADGMGGSQGGEVAAKIAIDTFAELLEQPLPKEQQDCYDLLLQQFYKADIRIREQASQSFELLGMGTTLMAVILTQKDYLHLYAGDCRLYHFRNAEPIYTSPDHSIVRFLQDLGKITSEEAATHPMRSKVSSCLGGRGATGEFSIGPKWDESHPPIYPLETGDRLLLCSDGLHSSVSQGELTSIICNSGLDLEQLTDTLIEKALSAGGDDNITVLITGIY